jgi:hypothetical protein
MRLYGQTGPEPRRTYNNFKTGCNGETCGKAAYGENV